MTLRIPEPVAALIVAAIGASCLTVALTWPQAPHGPAVTVVVPTDQPSYWNMPAPRWCTEDMLCWIGSTNDSRTDIASLRDWRWQMRHVISLPHNR